MPPPSRFREVDRLSSITAAPAQPRPEAVGRVPVIVEHARDTPVLAVPGMAVGLVGDAIAQTNFDPAVVPAHDQVCASQVVAPAAPAASPAILDVAVVPLHNPRRVVGSADGEDVLAEKHPAEGDAEGSRGRDRTVESLDPHEVGTVRAALFQDPVRAGDEGIAAPSISAGEMRISRPTVVEAGTHGGHLDLTARRPLQATVVALERAPCGREACFALSRAGASVRYAVPLSAESALMRISDRWRSARGQAREGGWRK
mmetsp:Transcript_128734/g.305452  ORF Transcript_128734/g.305452 Transcript_128734/m.305452 type:complete len:258 (-) Transcript_128734:546-1319(-)